jgi:GTP-binding protein HflX
MQVGSGVALIEVRPNGNVSGLTELRLLSESAGYNVLGEFEQSRYYDPSFCLGRGKAEEIARKLKVLKPAKVIMNNRLKPVQKYNLTKLFATEVIDRFQLILEIFTKKAGTIEAKYQIELAKLQYELPIARESVRLAKLGELPGFHGLGKYQVDIYATMIKKRISYLRSRLEEIRNRKSMHRQKRRKEALFSVALTGYTFAGKTALFNYVTKESLLLGNTLFTTLSTTTRAFSISNRKILLSDTVGFIDNLPHLLVDAFYSTLEEVTLADSVLLILDSSDALPEFSRKLRTCLSTLNEIGVFSSAIMPVLNKIDLAIDLEPLQEEVVDLLGVVPVKTSAKTGHGVPELLGVISSKLPPYECIKLRMPLSKNMVSLLSWASKEADVRYVKYYEDDVEMEVHIHPAFLPRFKWLLHGFEDVKIQYLKAIKT